MNKLIRFDVILPVLIALLMMTLDHHDRPFTVRDVKTKIVNSDFIIHCEGEHLVSSLAVTRVTANFLVLLAAHCVKTNVSGGVFDFSKDFVSSRNLRVGIDTMGRKENQKVGCYSCHSQGGNQVFSFTMDNEIRIDDLCLDVANSKGPVMMVKCHHQKGNQYWEYNIKTNQLIHTNSKQCLTKPIARSANEPRMERCDGSLDSQKWSFRNMTVPGLD
jgi:hypothetical protein